MLFNLFFLPFFWIFKSEWGGISEFEKRFHARFIFPMFILGINGAALAIGGAVGPHVRLGGSIRETDQPACFICGAHTLATRSIEYEMGVVMHVCDRCTAPPAIRAHENQPMFKEVTRGTIVPIFRTRVLLGLVGAVVAFFVCSSFVAIYGALFSRWHHDPASMELGKGLRFCLMTIAFFVNWAAFVYFIGVSNS